MGGIFDIMHDVNNCLYGSIGQAVTDAGWTEIWTTQTMSKNNYWLTNEDPTILAQINNLPENQQNQDAAEAYTNFLEGPFGTQDINHWSSSLILVLQTRMSTCYEKDDWGAVLGAVGSFSSAISAAMTQDTTSGQTEGKNMQSQLQTDNTALQPISDFGSAYSQFLSALANVLSQVGPGA